MTTLGLQVQQRMRVLRRDARRPGLTPVGVEAAALKALVMEVLAYVETA